MSENAHESHGAGHVSPISLYVTIFVALMVLTARDRGCGVRQPRPFNFPVAMVIAGFKASLVIWFFMHVKYQSQLTKLTVATGLFFLAILLGLMLVDYGSKGFVPMPPPIDSESVIGGSPDARELLLLRGDVEGRDVDLLRDAVGSSITYSTFADWPALVASDEASAFDLPFITAD